MHRSGEIGKLDQLKNKDEKQSTLLKARVDTRFKEQMLLLLRSFVLL